LKCRHMQALQILLMVLVERVRSLELLKSLLVEQMDVSEFGILVNKLQL